MIDAARLTAAQQLLAYTTAPLDTIAVMLGYAGAAPFVRAFTRWEGISPGRWRAGLASTTA
jgi:AraC-like DNA-binding protein